MIGGLLWTSSDHGHVVLTGLHDLRFLPLDWTLLDRAGKAGKPELNGGTPAVASGRICRPAPEVYRGLLLP